MNNEQFKSEVFEMKKAHVMESSLNNRTWFNISPIFKLVMMTDIREELTSSNAFELLLDCHCMDFCDMSDEFEAQLHNYCDEILSRCKLPSAEPKKKSFFQRLFS